MTENKRFNRFDVYFDDFMQLWTVSDNENDNMLYPCTSENMANEFCKLLNELNEENKELKDLLKSMADKNGEIWLDNGQIIRLKKVFKGEWTND